MQNTMLNNFTPPEYIEYTEDGKAVITLSRSMMIDGKSTPKITMREPTVKDELIARKSSGNDEADRESRLLSNLCGISKEAMQDMPLRDYKRIQEAFIGFLA